MKPELSNEQKQYLQAMQRKKYWILTAQVSLLLILLFLWEWAVDCDYLNGFIFNFQQSKPDCTMLLYNDTRLQYFYPHRSHHARDNG